MTSSHKTAITIGIILIAISFYFLIGFLRYTRIRTDFA